MNGIVAAIGVAAVLLGIIAYQEWWIDKLKTQTAEYKTSVETLRKTDEKNQQAILRCKTVAAKNIKEAERRKVLAELAAAQSKQRTKELEDKLAVIRGNVAGISASIVGTCVAADDPAYVDFLCSGPVGCD